MHESARRVRERIIAAEILKLERRHALEQSRRSRPATTARAKGTR